MNKWEKVGLLAVLLGFTSILAMIISGVASPTLTLVVVLLIGVGIFCFLFGDKL